MTTNETKPTASRALGYLPRLGYRGWVCTCGARAQRRRHLPQTFTCERPTCESQHAEWIDEVQE